MKVRLATEVLAQLELSADASRELHAEAMAIIHETIALERLYHAARPRRGSEEMQVRDWNHDHDNHWNGSERATSHHSEENDRQPYRLEDDPRFDRRHWKPVRRREDFSVFKERLDRRHRPASSISSSLDPLSSVSSSAFYSSPTSASTSSSSSSGSSSARSTSTCKLPSPSSSPWISPMTWSAAAVDPASRVGRRKPPHVPTLVAAGELDGDLEDVIFGCLAGDDTTWRLRTAVVQDKFADARILAQLVRPSPGSPCDSMAIKWFSKELPAVLGAFLQRRDYVVLEATGFAEEAHGERYGYHLLHSVDLPGAPELGAHGILRARLSLCFVCRRGPSSQRVRAFARGFSDARGHLLHAVANVLTAEAMLSATLVGECAHRKKLRWLMQRKQRHRLATTRQRGLSCATGDRTAAVGSLGGICGCCHKGTTGNHTAGDDDHTNGSQSSSSSSAAVAAAAKLFAARLVACQACGSAVCPRCTVHKRLVVDPAAEEVLERTLAFCVQCNLEAKSQSALDVARAMIPGAPDGGERPMRTPSSVTMTKSPQRRTRISTRSDQRATSHEPRAPGVVLY